MFTKTRASLTAWYCVIIMAISIAFSTFIYFGATKELDRALRMQRFHIEHPEIHLRILPNNSYQLESRQPISQPDPQVIEEAKIRVLVGLISINGIILLFSTLAGYFLAGRTLRPIKQMVDEQNRFITDASHELRTPLTALRSSIEVNLRDKKLTLTKAKEILQSNLEEIENLGILSEELIDVNGFQTIHNNSNKTKVQLLEVVHIAQQKVAYLTKIKKSTITTHIDANIYLYANVKSITELFVILLDNALKYSNDEVHITIHAKKEGQQDIITIKDTGIGIAPVDLPHIFDRFYRADKSRTNQGISGHGLGLSIAKRIVEMHKGTIQVTSELGKGTTFILDFPNSSI